MRLMFGRSAWGKTSLAAALIVSLLAAHVALAQNKSAGTPAKQAATRTKTTSRSRAKAPARRRSRVQTTPTTERITEIQQALAREGFYGGTPDGKWDDATTTAMRNFQAAKSLPPTGKLSALSLQKLGLGSEIAGRAAPLPVADARPSALSESELSGTEPAEAPAN